MDYQNKDCVFCKLINQELPRSVVYEDQHVIGLMDIQPVNPGHTLIIPKIHSTSLNELEPETGAHMFKTAMLVSEALRKSEIKCEGVSFHLADGEAAGQDVFHVHYHVIPRFIGDGFGYTYSDSYSTLPERYELDETATMISNQINKEQHNR